jgi:heat shock protein HslJ
MKNLLMRSMVVCALLLAFIPAALAQLENPLAGTRWKLESMGGTPAVEGSNVTLEFVDEGQVTGSGGCNGFGGSYTLEGSAITFSGVASTLMLCMDEAVNQQETAFFAALQTAARYELADDGLTIWYGDGQEMRFGVAQSLTGIHWQLAAMGETPVVAGSVVSIMFGDDSSVSGTGGCNRFSGTYTVSSNMLTFSPLASTRMACVDAAASQQETAFFAALEAANGYALADDGLTIWYGDGQEMRLVATLAGTQWQLAALDGAPAVEGSVVTLAFDEDGRAAGTGGCNSFGGPYEVNGSAITFGALASTMMACVDGGISEQEAAFFAALAAADRFAISGGQLTIWYGDDQRLVFTSIVEAAASG